MNGLKLKEIICSGETILAPGVYDMISAILAEKANFPAIFVGGYGIAASHLGIPDVGIMTFTDILERIRMISNVTTKPIIVDADTGYGGLINLRHAVKSFQKLGVSAIQIEDQVFPKRCGHAKGVEVVTVEEMVKRISVTVDSRDEPEFLIIARTDCLTELGLNEAINRAQAYTQAGADLIFIESPKTLQQIIEIRSNIDKPLVFKMVPDGNFSDLGFKDLESLGYNLLIYPSLAFLSAADSIQNSFQELKRNGIVKNQSIYNFDRFSELIGFDEIYEFEKLWESAK